MAFTRHIATVMHPDKATRDRREALGFFDGWNMCIDPLEALARRSAKEYPTITKPSAMVFDGPSTAL